MPIRVVCDECDRQVTFEDRFAGKRVRCPKCKGAIDLPEVEDDFEVVEEEERPAPRNKSRAREEDERPRAKRSASDRDEDEDDRPRAARSSRDRDEEEDPPRKRSRDEDRDEPAEKKPKKKKKGGSKLVLWLSLGGGGVLVLGLIVGLILFFVLGGSVFGGLSEARYLPDGCEGLNSERVAQTQKTRYSQALEAKRGGISKLESSRMLGLNPADVERITTGRAGTESVTILTTSKTITPDEVKSGLKGGLAGLGGGDFSEEKVGGYSLYVSKGLVSRGFCIPESRVVIVGAAETLRKVLKRNGKPEFPAGFQRAYSDASFSSSHVLIFTSTGTFAGAQIPGLGAIPDATLLQTEHGTTFYTKTKVYFKDSEAAEEYRKKGIENLDKESPLGGEAAKEAKQNARISRSGSVVSSTTHVREQTMIDDLSRK